MVRYLLPLLFLMGCGESRYSGPEWTDEERASFELFFKNNPPKFKDGDMVYHSGDCLARVIGDRQRMIDASRKPYNGYMLELLHTEDNKKAGCYTGTTIKLEDALRLKK